MNELSHTVQVSSNPYVPAQYSQLSPSQQEVLLYLQKDILTSVALGQDYIQVIEQICHLMEAAVKNSVASVMLFDEVEGVLQVLTAPSLSPETISCLNNLRPGPGAGSCGNAVYRREPVFVCDAQTDPRWADIRQLAMDLNIYSCWSMPIRTGEQILGTFALSGFEKQLPEPFHRMLLEIAASIIGIVLERKDAQSRILYLASHDVLTDLPNRILVRDRLQSAITRAQRDRNRVAVLFIDLDNFKMVNDSLGHEAGDELLRQIADRLRKCVRESDTVARYGGDEFLVILPNIQNADTVMGIAENILDRIARPIKTAQFELNMTLSIGVSLYPDDGSDADTLERCADAAMYQAKESGRNTWRFFTAQMNSDTREHLNIRNGIRQGLERNEFLLHYQPQFDLTNGTLGGAEALLRWQHPQLGLLMPDQFIGLAEASGLIVPIGEWVLRTACHDAVGWQKKGLPPVVVAVNISSVQIRRGNLDVLVQDVLRESGLHPSLLEIEITESVLLQNTETVLQTLSRLKALGVRIAIDDFGTGYSSFAYLGRMSVDKIKIDQSFIRDMTHNRENASIARAIVQMAHGLSIHAVAEGVEEIEAMRMLVGYHCDSAQGYHLGRPVSINEFARQFEVAGFNQPQLFH